MTTILIASVVALLGAAVPPAAPPESPVRGLEEAITARRSPALGVKKTLRLAVIPVEFPDRRHDPRFSREDMERLYFSRGTYTDRSPSGDKVFGSIADFYGENSCDRLSIE